MSTFPIEQAVYQRHAVQPPQRLAHSPEFPQWQSAVETILTDFGTRPPGLRCSSAVFAQPLGAKHVVIVHVADMPWDDTTDPPLGYHVFVLPRDRYYDCLGDPFRVVEHFAPDWHARDQLPTLSWPIEPPAPRTIEQIRQVLQRVKAAALHDDIPAEQQDIDPGDYAESPALLGGVQVLVDGGRLAFVRPHPDTDLLKALWMLLPNTTRADLWPASFAFDNKLEFDVLVTTHFDATDHDGYSTEDQAADYPEGRYELNLQIAAEEGNQRDLDDLLNRRSWNDAWRLAVTLFIAVVVLVLGGRLLSVFVSDPPAPRPMPTEVRRTRAKIVASVAAMTDPWSTITVLPVARNAWYQFDKNTENQP